jgi:uncharacterized protein HemX
MNMDLIAWALGLGAAVTAMVLQWRMLRAIHLKAMAVQRTRHQLQQQAAVAKVDQAKRQIAQLQQELAAARLELTHRRDTSPSAPAKAFTVKKPVRRDVDTAAASRPRLPPDGFADTLPSPQFPHSHELLAR